MAEGIFTLIGASLGFLGAIIAAKIGRNKDLTKNDIESAIEGADRNVYKEVEQLNRQLKKDISDENIRHQNKWEQKKIDADLIAQSRIDWIQKVRESTANLIASYGKLTNERERAEYLITLNDIRINSEILKLYFGSKKQLSNDTEISDIEKNMMVSENSNDDKNNLIVKYINYLVNEYIRENSKSTFEKKMKLQDLLVQVKEELASVMGYEYDYDYVPEDIFSISNFINEDDKSYSHNNILSKEDILEKVEGNFKSDGIDTNSEEVEAVLEYIYKVNKTPKYSEIDEDKIEKMYVSLGNFDVERIYFNALDEDDLSFLLKKYVDLFKELEDNNDFIKDLNDDLNLLSEAIRIYLKLEWDIAKKGE